MGMNKVTLSEFIVQDMKDRGMESLREYAEFLGITHPTLSKYVNDPSKSIQWEFLVKLSSKTKTDIGVLARYAAPEVAFETLPDTNIIAERINRLPGEFRKTILDMVDAYLAQQKRTKN
jgi:hypothetical protein